MRPLLLDFHGRPLEHGRDLCAHNLAHLRYLIYQHLVLVGQWLLLLVLQLYSDLIQHFSDCTRYYLVVLDSLVFVFLDLPKRTFDDMACDSQILSSDIGLEPVRGVAEDGNVAEDIEFTDALDSFRSQRFLRCIFDSAIETS